MDILGEILKQVLEGAAQQQAPQRQAPQLWLLLLPAQLEDFAAQLLVAQAGDQQIQLADQGQQQIAAVLLAQAFEG